MIKLKKIYYPILAALFAIALILGFVSSAVNLGAKADDNFVYDVRANMEVMGKLDNDKAHNSYDSANKTKIREDIVSKLGDYGVLKGGGSISDDYAGAVLDDDNLDYVVQNTSLNEDVLQNIPSADDELLYIEKSISNIIVGIKGENEDEAVLFTANYDSAAKSQSGLEYMQVASMLKVIKEVAKDVDAGKMPKRTLVFVFTDAEHEGALGAYAFRYRFKGFDGVTEKIKYAVNFGAQGTGPLAVSADKLSVSDVKGMASGLNNLIDDVYSGVSDYDVYDCAKINVFFTGNRDYINTSRDTVDKVTDAQIKAFGGAMQSLVNAYAYGDIAEGGEGAFSYMGLTFSHGKTASYILGAVALVLLIVAAVEIVRNGKKLSGLLSGLLGQLIAIVATAVILYACYFVLTLLLAGFGVVPIHAIVTIRYMNIGLFISALLLAFAAYAGVFLLVRRFYKVKATDMARAGAMLIMLLGAVMAFALPTASLVFVLTAILEGVALIIAAELSKMFKAKYEADFERLFIYTLPLILLTPAMIPVMMMASYTLSAVYFPLILTVAVIGFGVIAPYFGLLKPALSGVFAKLPKHTIRVEKTVTEEIPAAKKGRPAQTVTRKKVVNEKVEWRYHNRYGIAILGILSSILIILFAVCPTYQFSTNIVDTFSYREAAKDNAIVYVWESLGSGENSLTEKIRIYDQVAYKYFGRIDNDYTWNSEEGAYEKDFSGNTSSLIGSETPITLTSEGNNTMRIKTCLGAVDSFIDIKLTNMSTVTMVTIIAGGDRTEINNDGNATVCIQLPYSDDDYGDFRIEFTHEGSSLMVGVDVMQYMMGARTIQNMRNLSEYKDIVDRFNEIEASFAKEISCGMIFHRNRTIEVKN